MAITNKYFLDEQGLSTVANHIKERLKTVSTMPATAGDGTVLLYKGATSGSYTNGHIYQYSTTTNSWVDISPSGGHTMSPTTSSSLTEDTIVSTINNTINTNEEVASLYGIQKWTNEKRIRRIMNGSDVGALITTTGIGTWTDKSSPTSEDETDWWYDSAFIIPNNVSTDNIDISIKFDPSGETIALGGFILDTTTGKLCIKFANKITNIATAKVAVDITYTRNEVG